MSRAIKNPALVWHCTAGFAGVTAIENFWHRPKSQGGLAWNAKGYCVIVELDGTIWWLHTNAKTKESGYKKEFNPRAFEFVTNGVRGFNSDIVNVSTIGGVENVNGKWIAKDTRTEAQKASQLVVIRYYFDWLKANGGDLSEAEIFGHFHYSTDKNRNGIIDSWERIKECPSYDAQKEFRWLLMKDNKLPNQK
jgi:N-acetylmuramoyl-L-alanine amidase